MIPCAARAARWSPPLSTACAQASRTLSSRPSSRCASPAIRWCSPYPTAAPSTCPPWARWPKPWVPRVIHGQDQLNRNVHSFTVAAMQMHNFLQRVTHGTLVITSGDRSDVIVACLASLSSQAMPKISGIVLTGGLVPEKTHPGTDRGFFPDRADPQRPGKHLSPRPSGWKTSAPS